MCGVFKGGLWNLVFVHARGRFLSMCSVIWRLRCNCLSRRAKKAQGLEQHKKLQREKEEKRKQKREVSLPAKHKK